MAEVEAKQNYKSQLDAILNFLRDFRDAVNTEQINDDEIYNIQQTECASEDVFRSIQAQDAQTILRDSCFECLQHFQNQKNQYLTQEHMTKVFNTAETETGYFKRRERDYEDALHAINEAQDILTSIYSGQGSFAEISRVSKSMLQTAINVKETAKLASIFYAFTQLAAQEGQLDESALQRAAQLLDRLRSNIQEAYNDYATSNTASLLLSMTKRKDQDQPFPYLKPKMKDSKKSQPTQFNVLELNQPLLLQENSKEINNFGTQTLCSTIANEYNYATQARRNEIQLIAQLEEMVAKRLDQVEDENHERNQKLAAVVGY